jgi:hypothetical protein
MEVVCAAAALIIRLEIDSNPSFAPSTPARSHPFGTMCGNVLTLCFAAA